MSTNEELKRDIAWLETWVDVHPEARAASRVSRVVAAIKAMDSSNEPVEPGIPLVETAGKYIWLKSQIISRIPPDSLWDKVHGEEAKADNFFLHLYNEHRLGCVDCFGGANRV